MTRADFPPAEAAIREGYGLPVWSAAGRPIEVLLDGMPMRRVVAFSVPRGLLWRHQEDSRGRLIRKGNDFEVERLDGEVQVRWRGCGQ